MEYWFYHLEQSSLEATLPTLLEKTIERGWVARLQFKTKAMRDEMDKFLWLYREDSFLPHGADDAPLSDQHPILLTTSGQIADDAVTPDVVFLIGGAEPEALGGVKRCITMVDNQDADGRSIARLRWSQAKAEGALVSYWRQDDRGRWTKQ